MVACDRGRVECVQLLLGWGVNTNQQKNVSASQAVMKRAWFSDLYMTLCWSIDCLCGTVKQRMFAVF